MNEPQPIRITEEDIAEANRLSLSCPICAGAVEDNTRSEALQAVVCANCLTFYHRDCWKRNGGKCAILGCEHQEARVYGPDLEPALRIRYSDLPRHRPSATGRGNGRQRQLKREQKRIERERANREFWGGLLQRILRAVGWR
ncbi:MAG: RING finger protein [Candidatus Promineifilaceae bacterium]|nr:RING finger protein [Candidatus Promineifilaceae bacterium]